MFQHTAARRRLERPQFKKPQAKKFQHTVARRRLAPETRAGFAARWFQHTAARRRLGTNHRAHQRVHLVSTHSRPKAAGKHTLPFLFFTDSFNTQPPEGGWHPIPNTTESASCFNTQPPEGGWELISMVQKIIPCFNTQPPEGGWLIR